MDGRSSVNYPRVGTHHEGDKYLFSTRPVLRVCWVCSVPVYEGDAVSRLLWGDGNYFPALDCKLLFHLKAFIAVWHGFGSALEVCHT